MSFEALELNFKNVILRVTLMASKSGVVVNNLTLNQEQVLMLTEALVICIYYTLEKMKGVNVHILTFQFDSLQYFKWLLFYI